MLRALHLGSTLFAAAFVVLTAVGVMSLGGRANADGGFSGDCGPKENGSCPNQCMEDGKPHCITKTCSCGA